MENKTYSRGKITMHYCPEKRNYGISFNGRIFVLSERSFDYLLKLDEKRLEKYFLKNNYDLISMLRKNKISISHLEKLIKDIKEFP